MRSNIIIMAALVSLIASGLAAAGLDINPALGICIWMTAEATGLLVGLALAKKQGII